MLNVLDQQFDICEGDFNISEDEHNTIISGMVLSLDSNSEIVIFKNSGTDNSPFGLACDDFDETSDEVRNTAPLVRRKTSIYRGYMWIETDQFDLNQSYIPNNPVYADTSSDGVTYGQLTTAVPQYNQIIVGTVIKYHASRGILECTIDI